MRCFVLTHEHEGLIFVAAFQPGQSFVRDDVRRIPGVFSRQRFTVWSGSEHRRIVVGPLPLKNVVIVKALRRRDQVPFANDCCLVVCLLQELRKCLLVTVETIAVAKEPIQVAVFSGLNDGATGPADGVGDIAPRESHPLLSDAVQIGRGDSSGVVGADSLLAMVIGENEQYVRFVGGERFSRRQ